MKRRRGCMIVARESLRSRRLRRDMLIRRWTRVDGTRKRHDRDCTGSPSSNYSTRSRATSIKTRTSNSSRSRSTLSNALTISTHPTAAEALTTTLHPRTSLTQCTRSRAPALHRYTSLRPAESIRSASPAPAMTQSRQAPPISAPAPVVIEAPRQVYQSRASQRYLQHQQQQQPQQTDLHRPSPPWEGTPASRRSSNESRRSVDLPRIQTNV